MLVGDTSSNSFPTTPGARDRSHNGGFPYGDVIVVKLSAKATDYVYSSFLGGTGGEEADAAALLPSGSLAIVGWTESPNFPVTAGAFQTQYLGQRDGFLAIESLLPDGVSRYGVSTPWCRGSLTIDVVGMAQAGGPEFGMTCRGAPLSAQGVLVLGAHQNLLGTPVLGGTILHVAALPPISFLVAPSNGIGVAFVRVPIPLGVQGARFFAQFGWPMPLSCPSPYLLTSSDALDVTVQ
jgi:hypothetical protein